MAGQSDAESPCSLTPTNTNLRRRFSFSSRPSEPCHLRFRKASGDSGRRLGERHFFLLDEISCPQRGSLADGDPSADPRLPFGSDSSPISHGSSVTAQISKRTGRLSEPNISNPGISFPYFFSFSLPSVFLLFSCPLFLYFISSPFLLFFSPFIYYSFIFSSLLQEPVLFPSSQ
jgi:hypothetical protein